MSRERSGRFLLRFGVALCIVDALAVFGLAVYQSHWTDGLGVSYAPIYVGGVALVALVLVLTGTLLSGRAGGG
jgi:hypothetical protein